MSQGERAPAHCCQKAGLRKPRWLGGGSWQVGGRVVTALILNPERLKTPDRAWWRPEFHSQILGWFAHCWQVLLLPFHLRLRPMVTSPWDMQSLMSEAARPLRDQPGFRLCLWRHQRIPAGLGLQFSAYDFPLIFTHTDNTWHEREGTEGRGHGSCSSQELTQEIWVQTRTLKPKN